MLLKRYDISFYSLDFYLSVMNKSKTIYNIVRIDLRPYGMNFWIICNLHSQYHFTHSPPAKLVTSFKHFHNIQYILLLLFVWFKCIRK